MPTGDDAQPILPFPLHEATLANGLRVIVVPTGFPHLVSLQIAVAVGSRNELEPGKSGFAHFFEHMMFRGTKRYPPEVYHAIVTRTGARQNAYTTDDFTNYHATFAKEDLATFLEIEADRFMNLEYSEDAFRIEAKAILGEYNKNASEPLVKLFEVQRDTAFDVHPYKHTTMGFLHDIEAMPEQFAYSRLFFERWYRPERTTVIVAGDVDPEETIEMVERFWGSWRGGGAVPAIPAEPPPSAPRAAHVPWPAPTLPWVTIAFRGPAFSVDDPEYLAVDVALDLAFGPTSELYHELVDEDQVVDQLFPWFTPHVDPSLATVLARLKRPEDAPYVRRRILETLAALRESPPDEERVEAAKAHNRNAVARTFDNSESVASFIARFAHFERSAETVNRLYASLARLSPEEILVAVRRYVSDASLVQTTLSHEPLPAEAVEPPRLPTRASVSLGRPVIVVRSTAPPVHVKVAFTTGSADDPPGREGLAHLTASLLAEGGSRRHTIDDIRRRLYPLGGSLNAQVDKELTVFSIVAPRETIDRTLDVVLPQLLEPGWREADFARLKAQQRHALTQDLRTNNDEELGKEVLQERAFAGTPYRHPVLGTVAGIDTIALEDAKAFAGEALGRARVLLGVAGAPEDSVVQRLERELGGSLPAGVPAPERSIVGRQPRGLEVTIVRKETRATAISLGHPIEVRRGHPDFPALWLARAWLGEHRAQQGRLFQRMRELRGLNYGDYAYIEAFPRGMFQFFPDPNVVRRAQLFEVWLRPVLPEHATFALKLALFEIRRLLERGLDPEEFEATRTYLKKNAYLLTKSLGHRLGSAIDSWWYGIPDFVTYIHEGLDALTPERVHEAVRRHISPSDHHVVFVTKDAEGLRAELLAGGSRSITYQSPPPPDVLTEDELVGETPLDVDPRRVEVVPVEEVFAR